jgi:hypothetical protein
MTIPWWLQHKFNYFLCCQKLYIIYNFFYSKFKIFNKATKIIASLILCHFGRITLSISSYWHSINLDYLKHLYFTIN